MLEKYNEGDQPQRWFKVPDLSFEKLLRSERYEARQGLPILDFQDEFVDRQVPKQERVERGDFAAFVGNIISANAELIEFSGGDDEYSQSVAAQNYNDIVLDVNYLDCSDGIRHNVSFLTPRDFMKESKFSTYSSGNMASDKPWVMRRDSPVHAGGEQFESYVSGDEIQALGSFIQTEFGLNVPEFDPESYKDL